MQTKRFRFIFPLTILFVTFFSVAKAQTGGLTTSDLSSIVQQCVDLSGLQSYYPVDGSGNLEQINIVSHPYVFPSGMTVSKGGNAVNFISNASFSTSPVANYFMFRSIAQSGTTVNLSGHYYYNSGGTQSIKSITIDYTSSSGVWTITSSSIN